MSDEKNETGDQLDDQSKQEINSLPDEFSGEQDSDIEILETEEVGTEEIISPPTNSEIVVPVPEKPKKNYYKIAFFTLGGVIALGTASFFGYQYFNKPIEVIAENTCLDTDTKIYDAYKDAVVMVKHRYKFVAKIKGKEIQLDIPDSVEETLYGTAFFVDEKGNMITNSHVLQPWNSPENTEKINTDAANIRRKISSILTTDISEDGYETFIASNWGNSSAQSHDEGDGEGYDEGPEGNGEEFISSNETEVDSAVQAADLAASIPQKDYVSEDEIEVYMKTVDISVALHNSAEEWLPCTIEKISEEQSVDLGVLQLTNKETPNSVVNIVNLENAELIDGNLRPGQKAVMIGYPLGEDLAQTNSGIKVQLYNGQISKESDGTKIQYSVTSTHGASGSPVFNNCGQLIAVNFSGVENVQGFNFGIIAKQINSVYSFISFKMPSETSNN